MRNSRTLAILGLITLAAVLAAIFSRQESTAIPREGEPLFPELMSNINDTVEVARIGKDETFTLTRRDDGWGVKEKAGYPAAAEKVHQLIVGSAQLRRVEPKTRKPELYDKLGVEDVDQEGAKSVKISLKNTSGDALAEFILGERRWGAGDPDLSQYYVRLPNDPQVWLVEGNIPDDKSLVSWLDNEILEIDSARIREVRVTHPDGHTVVVRRSDPNSNDYELVGLPKGAELESQWAVNSIGNTFTDLTLDDVRPASDVKFKKPADLTVELDSFDGLRIRMETMKRDDKNFARFSARFEPSLVRDDGKTETAESGDKDTDEKAKLKDSDAVKKQAEALNARWKDWLYVIPRYRIDGLAKKKSDLIKSEKTPKAG